MNAKTLLIIAALIQLSGCIATPRIEIPEKITFDAIQPEQKSVSYNDMLCCWRCNA